MEKNSLLTFVAFFSCSAICRCRLLVSRNSTSRNKKKAGNWKPHKTANFQFIKIATDTETIEHIIAGSRRSSFSPKIWDIFKHHWHYKIETYWYFGLQFSIHLTLFKLVVSDISLCTNLPGELVSSSKYAAPWRKIRRNISLLKYAQKPCPYKAINNL